MNKILAALAVALTFTSCTSKQALEDAPIITSATHQADISWSGDAHFLGASKEVALVIK